MAGMESDAENLEAIARKLMDMGVKEKVIIHMKDRGVCLSKDGFTLMPAYAASKEYIKGKTGAGDAFCAGVSIGLTYGKDMPGAIEIGSTLAASVITSSENVCPRFMPEELGLEKKYICHLEGHHE